LHDEADMLIPPQITYRGMPRVDWLEADILTRIARLGKYYDGITGCRVLVELAHRHHEAGNRYHVRIDLTVRGEEIVVSHDATLHAAEQDIETESPTKQSELRPEHKHVKVAIRQAFDVARRRLQDYGRRQRGAVKLHQEAPHGRVVRLLPEEDCGFIEAPDGREIYFHKNSVLDPGFERLEIGSEVSFVEERGDRGPQASTVRPVAGRRARRLARVQ
jgi:cold shock CspA family protein